MCNNKFSPYSSEHCSKVSFLSVVGFSIQTTQLPNRWDYRISNSVTVDFTKLWVSSEYCTDASGILQDILAKKCKSLIKCILYNCVFSKCPRWIYWIQCLKHLNICSNLPPLVLETRILPQHQQGKSKRQNLSLGPSSCFSDISDSMMQGIYKSTQWPHHIYSYTCA